MDDKQFEKGSLKLRKKLHKQLSRIKRYREGKEERVYEGREEGGRVSE